MPETKLTDETQRRVHFAVTYDELTSWLKRRALEEVGLSPETEVSGLRVDVGGDRGSATFVRGTVPMTREHLLETLGLTPTEPVETDGAAVAEGLGDRVVGTSDVVETPETLAAFAEVAGDPDAFLRAEDSSGERVDVDVVHRELAAGLDVDRCLELLRARLRWLRSENDRAPSWGAAVAARLEEVRQVEGLLRRYGPDGARGERLVPRPVTEDNLRQARLKLAVLANSPRTPDGRATATELHYVLSLLGGEP